MASKLTHKVDVLPRGPVTPDTELVVIKGVAFLNAAKCEEVVDRHIATAERLARKLNRVREYIAHHRETHGHDRVVGQEVLTCVGHEWRACPTCGQTERRLPPRPIREDDETVEGKSYACPDPWHSE